MSRLGPEWVKSTRSQPQDNCVEARFDPETSMVQVRDSKLGTRSSVLGFTPAEWRAFREGVLSGEFDLP